MKSLFFSLFLTLSHIVSSQTIFEYDIIENRVNKGWERTEVSGAISLDKDWKEIKIEQSKLIFTYQLDSLENKTQLTDRITSYRYNLGGIERLNIFTFEDKIYAIYIQTISGKWTCTKFLKKYL